MIGTILGGRYEILEVVGSGGMAIVYKAKCRLLGRYVAIKMLREELRDDKDFVERFKAEARSAASLNHPNVVSVFDVGTDGEREYFVMEYIEGITLKEIVDSKTLTWKSACSYAIQIAGAIEHAHRKSIIHRDIKPHNIMITKDNVVKVTDFGIARAVTNSTIVRAGNVIGSVHYFSPEQACGGAVDFKSDIYSMGVVLYEMLTGEVPFDAENPVAIAKMHVDNEVRPPMEINDKIPEAVNDIVLKAMAKQPSKRYQTPAAMAADLKQAVSDPASINVKDNDATQFVPVVTPSDKSYSPEKEDKIIIKGDMPRHEDKNRKNASKAAWVVASVVFAVSLFIIIGAAFPSVFGFGKVIEIPKLVGLNLSDAEKLCEEKGFVIEEETGEYSDKYNEGQIMEQTPAAGFSKKVDKIVVKISKGLSKISLKDYTGKDVDIVKGELARLGIDVIIEKTEDDTMPENAIIKHSPSGGSTIKAGTTVTLYVSSGKESEMVEVPNIIDSKVGDVRTILELHKLKIGSVKYEESISQDGRVIRMFDDAGAEIVPGTEIESDSAINIVVGRKPEQPVTPPESENNTVGSDSGAVSRQ